jgi:hypothetical protein
MLGFKQAIATFAKEVIISTSKMICTLFNTQTSYITLLASLVMNLQYHSF